jgi:tetratricopeptide (TPR) repeat protein
MLTIKNSLGKYPVFLLLAVILAGCTPAGPRALLDGKQLLDRGRYVEAIERLKVATSVIGTNALAWHYLGLACHHAGQATNAIQAYSRALVLDHDLMEARYNLGCVWLDQDRADLAKAEFTAYTLQRGNSPEGWLKLGTAQARLREFTAAEKSLAEALRINPRNLEALNGLGMIDLQRNRPREAAETFSNILKIQPDYAPALLNLAIVAHHSLNNRPLALQKYREYLALPVRPADWDRVNAVARALEQELNTGIRPANVANAQPQLSISNAVAKPSSDAVTRPAISPKPVPPATNVARTPPAPAPSAPPVLSTPPLETVEVVRLPPEPLIKAAQDVPDRTLTVNTPQPSQAPGASILQGSSGTTEKRGVLQQMNPMNLFRREDHSVPMAVRSNESLAGGPRSSEVETHGGAVPQMLRYRYRNLPKPAAGDSSAAQRAFAQGAQAQGAGHLPEAIQAYRRATQLDPAYYEAYYNLGLACATAGNLQQSLAAYETALAIRPDWLDARYNFALVLKQGNYVMDAVNELQKILAVYPNEARAHLALGNLYARQLRQPDKARGHYLKVLDADPRNPQAPAIRYWLTANKP